MCTNFFARKGDKPEIGSWCRNNRGVAIIVFLYSSITGEPGAGAGGEVKFPLLLFGFSVFSVSHIRYSHPTLYST